MAGVGVTSGAGRSTAWRGTDVENLPTSGDLLEALVDAFALRWHMREEKCVPHPKSVQRALANEEGLSPETTRTVYRAIVKAFMTWAARMGSPPRGPFTALTKAKHDKHRGLRLTGVVFEGKFPLWCTLKHHERMIYAFKTRIYCDR